MFNEPRVCIVGPSVDTNYFGGVATHIKNLRSLSCFRDAVVIDPGSRNSNLKKNILNIIKNIIELRSNVIIGKFSHVLVNTSIYPSALIKLFMILAFLPAREGMEIYVFFHGGRFQSLNPIFKNILKLLLFPLMAKVKKLLFLSRVQMEGFCNLFSNCQAGLYANYSTTDEIMEKKLEPVDNILKMLFVGRVVKEKGVYEMLSAVEKIALERGSVRLIIVGDGPDLAELINMNKKIPKNTVNFMGYLTGIELEDAYKKADVLILPTYHPEGFPYVIIEAMRAGLPIISTSEGALETLVLDGVTGFKILPKDVDSIVTAVSKINDNRVLLEEMSQKCHRYFQDNLSRSAAEKYYSELIFVSH